MYGQLRLLPHNTIVFNNFFIVRIMMRLYVLAAAVFVSILTENVVDSRQGVRYQQPVSSTQGTVGLCDDTKDCNKDIDCKAGLVCSNEHQEFLKSLGYDEHRANCKTIGSKPWIWDVCFDRTRLRLAAKRNERTQMIPYDDERDGPDSMSLIEKANRSLTGTVENPFCVYNSSMLVRASNQAISIGPKYTRIDICVNTIKLWHALNVTNKRIELSCKMKRCVIDGIYRSRFMIGKHSNIVINGIEFVHGYSTLQGTTGSAFQFQDSTIVMRNIHFRKNNFTNGAILYSNISFPIKNKMKKKANITLVNITFENNIGLDVLRFANSSVQVNHITIRNNSNSNAITALKNTDLTIMASSINNNRGLDGDYFMLFNESTIVLKDVSIRTNSVYCLLSTERSKITIVKSSITNTDVNDDNTIKGSYRYGMLFFRDSIVHMDSVSIMNNWHVRGNVELVNSNVSMINTDITNNYADNGSNIYVTNSHCELNGVYASYNEPHCYKKKKCLSVTMDLTNSTMMMYNTTFYHNPMSPGYLLSSDRITTLLCDQQSILCYNYELSNETIQGNCTFSKQCP